MAETCVQVVSAPPPLPLYETLDGAIDRVCIVSMVTATTLTTPSSSYKSCITSDFYCNGGLSSRDSPNTSRRVVLGAHNVLLVGENPACSVPAVRRCEGVYGNHYGYARNEYAPFPRCLNADAPRRAIVRGAGTRPFKVKATT